VEGVEGVEGAAAPPPGLAPKWANCRHTLLQEEGQQGTLPVQWLASRVTLWLEPDDRNVLRDRDRAI